jgi:predicted enzyme related to lactoylglutathione lyase
MPGVPSFWLAYVLVDDIGAATNKAKSLGAKIVKDSVEVPNMGWFTIIEDPTGAALAFWKPKK